MKLFKEKNGGLSLPDLGQIVPPAVLTLSFTYLPLNFWNNKTFLQEKYLTEGLSLEQIVSITGSSKYIVKRRLKQFGLADAWMRNHNRSLAKIRSLVEIKRLQGMGLTMRQVAAELSNGGFITPGHSKKWHPMMVSRIVREI